MKDFVIQVKYYVVVYYQNTFYIFLHNFSTPLQFLL